MVYEGDRFLGLGWFGSVTKDFIRVSARSVSNVNQCIMRSFAPNFEECSAVVDRASSCPMEEMEFAKMESAEDGRRFGEEMWMDEWCLFDGATVTIFGFDNGKLIAVTGSVSYPRYVKVGLGIITCSSIKRALGSPVLNSLCSSIGIVVDDQEDRMVFMTTRSIMYWMEKRCPRPQ